jgi:acetyltransferase-like isoleucine patch superfamily enzyme
MMYFFKGLRGSLFYLTRRALLATVNALAMDPSYRPSQEFRNFLLRLLGYKIGEGAQISEQFFILNCGNVAVGSGARIGTHARIYNFSPIKIGINFLASHGLTIISGTHDPITLDDRPGPVDIGNNVWIGINATIIGPVTIGDNVVIGAGSVVLKDIPSNAIAAGVPAKVIRFKSQISISND